MNGKSQHTGTPAEEGALLYRTAFEYSGTGMMLIEEDMTISLINRRLEEMSGYRREELEGKRKWIEFVHEDDRQRMLEFNRLRNEGKRAVPPAYEFRYLHKSGAVRDTLITVGMIPGTKRRLASLVDVTENKRMEQALRQSEKKYRDLFENANDIIYAHDLDGNIISVNAAGERTYGYTRDEMKRINIRDIVDPAFQPIVMEKIRSKIEGGGPTGPYEILTYAKERRPVWVEVSTRLTHDEEGRAVIEGIARDITQRKLAESELLESRKRISEVAEYMPAIICETDADFNVTWANKEGLRTFGYTEDDVKKGIKVLDIVHPDDRAGVLRDIDNILKGDYGNFVEHRFVRKDGGVVHLIVNSIPMHKDGKFSGIRSYIVDITEQRKAQRKLVASEERFRGMFEASPVGIALCGPDGRFSAVNPAFYAMFSIPPNTAPSKLRFSLFDMTPRESRLKAKLESGQNVRFETDGDMKAVDEKEGFGLVSTGIRYLQWTIAPLGGADSAERQLLVHVEDVTERRQAEDAKLAKARAETEKAQRMLEGLRRTMGEAAPMANMVGTSEEMRKLFDLLPEVAAVSTTVLVSGESGTGKELVARALHDLGPRKENPFIAINCSALPDNLLESELFGYKAGAFTDCLLYTSLSPRDS